MNTLEAKPHSTQRKVPMEQNSPTARIGLWIFVGVILLVAGLIFGLVPRLKARETLARETRELSTPTVNVVSAKPGKTSALLTLPAEVKPFIDAPIFARANGYLKKLQVDIGSNVKAGDLLAEIDTPELNRELESARAELTRDEAALNLAKITTDRWAELLKTQSVSDQEAAEKKADFALKSAAVEAARANVHRLEELKAFSRIAAPFDGTITARGADVGDLISAGTSREIFHLADNQRLRVFVRVPQSMALDIAPGVSAELTIPELRGKKFAAKVVRTAGAIDPASRTLLTELEVENARGEILAGSYGQVNFGELKETSALTLPSNTLIFRSEGTQVAIVGENGKVKLRNITLGRDFGRAVEITSGITAADQIIVNPADALTSGETVKIVADEQPERKP